METRILVPEQFRIHVSQQAGRSRNPNSDTLTATKREHNDSTSKVPLTHDEQSETGTSESDDETVAIRTSAHRRKSGVCNRITPPHSRSALKNRRAASSSSVSSLDSESESGPEGEIGSNGDDVESNANNGVNFRKVNPRKLSHEQNPPNCGTIVKIYAKEKIMKGTQLSPNEGRIEVVKLDEPEMMPQDDVRSRFGSFDRLVDDPIKPGEKVRFCSWLGFAARSESMNSKAGVNMIARIVDGNALLEFCQDLAVGEEVVAYFDVNSNSANETSDLMKEEMEDCEMAAFSREGPLDLSNCKSPRSHKSSRSHSSASPTGTVPATLFEVHGPQIRPDCGISLSPDPSTSSSTISNEDRTSRRNRQSQTVASNSNTRSSLFSIRNVLQLQSPGSTLFQPHMFSLTSNAANASNSHPEQLILTPPLSSSTTNATTTALSSPTDSNRSVLSSPPSSNPKLSPFDSYSRNTHAGRSKFSHSNLHNVLTHYGFNPHGMGTSSSAPVAATSSLLRPILRTRGRERSLLPCEVCNKAFDRPSLLKRHMRTHTGEKPHVCDTCGKGFSTSSSLNTHRRIHSGEKPHQCPICGKRFTASSNLYYHRMTHNKEKPHKCLLCGKSFPTPGDLKSHQYVHSGSWPFSCRICNRGFSKQTNLRNHLLLHSGDKPHSCRFCSKKFALACNLRAHLRTHEEDSLSTCVSCNRSFVNSLNMVINGQCRVCAATNNINLKLHGSLLPTQLVPVSEIAREPQDDRMSPMSKFHSAGTLTSNITIPQPSNNTANSISTISLKRESPEARLEAQSQRKLHSLNHFPSSFVPMHGVPHPYNHLSHLQLPTTSASSPATTTAAGHRFHHPAFDHLQQLPFAAANFSGRSNPFLEQLFEWNLRVAKETVGNLGLMQQKLLESQVLAAQLMSSPTGLSDLLRLQANASNSNVSRGIPNALAGHDFSNVARSLGLLDTKK